MLISGPVMAQRHLQRRTTDGRKAKVEVDSKEEPRVKLLRFQGMR